MEKPNISGSSDTISRNYVSGDAQIFSFEFRETVGTTIVGPLGSPEVTYRRIQRFTLIPKKSLEKLLWGFHIDTNLSSLFHEKSFISDIS